MQKLTCTTQDFWVRFFKNILLNFFHKDCQQFLEGFGKRYHLIFFSFSCFKSFLTQLFRVCVLYLVIFILFFKWSHFEKLQTNYQRLSKFPKYQPYMEANTKYVDISKWTSTMSQPNAGPFLEFFDHFLKVIIMLRAFVVPP